MFIDRCYALFLSNYILHISEKKKSADFVTGYPLIMVFNNAHIVTHKRTPEKYSYFTVEQKRQIVPRQ